jgi:hypothetical protein
VLKYLQAGARCFGSTRTDQFVREFQGLPGATRAIFSEHMAGLLGPSHAAGAT